MITGSKRTVRAEREWANGVARSSRAQVAWSMEATFPRKVTEGQQAGRPVTAKESRLHFKPLDEAGRGTQAPHRSETARFPPISLALARSHPLEGAASGTGGA